MKAVLKKSLLLFSLGAASLFFFVVCSAGAFTAAALGFCVAVKTMDIERPSSVGCRSTAP